MTSNSVHPASIIALAPPSIADGPTESQMAFNNSPFKWLEYRLGVESFKCIGTFDESNIAAFVKSSEETFQLVIYAKLWLFTILITLGIVMPFCIP